MSRQVDASNLDELNEGDLKYLHDRGQITTAQFAEALGASVPELQAALRDATQEGIPLEERVNTGTANTAGVDQEGYERELKARNGIDPDGEGDEEDDEEEEESYEDMSNDALRAELSRRGLSVSGNKNEMIRRLEEDDASEEEEDDEE